MTPISRSAERIPPRRSLNRQLLLSHLSVALVGLGMLFIALFATYDLRSRVVVLADQGGPLAQASLRMLAGVRHSLASLRGWVSLGDPRFLDDWQVAWDGEIQPSLDRLKSHCQQEQVLEQTCAPERLVELQILLADLRESQWWVRDAARNPGNEPARFTYLLDVEPGAAELHSLIAALFEEEEAQNGDPERKSLLVQFARAQQAVTSAHLALREILGANGLEYQDPFREQLESVRTHIERIAASPLLTPEQNRLLDLFQNQLQAFTWFAQEVIRLRRIGGNVALDTMALETDPLATRAMALAAAIAADFQERLEREALAARAASAMTVWNLVLMILTMLVVAYALSKKHAEKLALPITSLAAATRRLAAGYLDYDISVHGNDELGELTQAFNIMRTSLQQAQAELREANAKLERRVAERTTELETANEALNLEIEVRRVTESALRDSEARLRAVTQALPDLVFVVDEDGRYRDILAAGREHATTGIAPRRGNLPSEIRPPEISRQRETPIAGRDRAATGITPIRGKLLGEVHSPEMAAFFLDIIHRALATQSIQIAEYELQTTSGLRWFESRTMPLEVQYGGKSATIVVARDLTQRKQAEVQLRQAQKMQAIGQLTGGIAHDFNNLLSIIMGNLELLHEQLTAQPRLHQLAQQALKAVDRGTNLTRRLLAFSRRQPLLAQPTDLNRLVLAMLDLTRRTLGANIQIQTVLANDLERTLVDPAQFENALLNLVINARDAMPQGGKLTLETANILLDEDYVISQKDIRPGPYVMLSVSDTGIGMPPEVLERVFEPFFTTKETSKGSGLGLSMVYGLVKQSGGHITLYSEPGQGTTVRLYLPRHQAEATEMAEPRVAETAPLGQGETILAVEDDPDVRQFAVGALQALGYDTRQAGDAETALEILDTTPGIALLFTDIVLPGDMDGVGLATEARRRHPALPVLFTSGYTEHTLLGDGRAGESADILTKPYRKAELASKLRALLGRRGSV
ncbi:MAG: ATP-binding protein [Candidatus Competibacter sp.]|nr:ATP-binding protein [Candidatus Competibacter sp.]